ncbi:MAG: hypothetical protein M1830_010662 [Pleopsidium flavum]|nr:MAG: hypothetical protein M1830_010662 [Pleopsidium flavum]
MARLLDNDYLPSILSAYIREANRVVASLGSFLKIGYSPSIAAVTGKTGQLNPSKVVDCSILEIQFFAGGSFLSFTFDSKSGYGIGVLDVEIFKIVWLLKESGRLNERGRYHDNIVFANHPLHPIVAWAGLGPRLSLCNFLFGAEPTVLQAEPRIPWKHERHFLTRIIAFSHCGRYLEVKSAEQVSMFDLSKGHQRRFRASALLEGPSLGFPFLTGTLILSDSYLVSTLGDAGEIVLFQHNFMEQYSRRATVSAIPASIFGGFDTSVTFAQTSDELKMRLLLVPTRDSIQFIILSINKIRWSDWYAWGENEEEDSLHAPTINAKGQIEKLLEEQPHGSSIQVDRMKEGKHRLRKEIRAYRKYMQDKRWKAIAKQIDAMKDYTYDEQGFPNEDLLEVISTEHPGLTWLPGFIGFVGGMFDWEMVRSSGTDELEPARSCGSRPGIKSCRSRWRVQEFKNNIKMRPLFVDWDSWSGYAGTLKEFDRDEPEQ